MDYSSRPSAGIYVISIIGGIVLLAMLFFVLCFRTVGVGQVGIITSFGHVTAEVQSGVVIKAPWPFQALSKFDIRTQKDQADAEAASQDLQDVNATVVTNFHIDPNKVGELYRTVGTDYKVRLIDPAIQESLKASTAQYPIADLIIKRAEVKATTLKALQSRLAPRGITVEDISLTNFEFSSAYKAAITQKQVAEQQAQQAKFLAEKATNEAAANVAAARGQAEAQALVQQSLTPELLQKMAIEKWNGVMPTTLADGGSILNIPIK